jgi:SDR family mycofactocin-dependent oxidoreductase
MPRLAGKVAFITGAARGQGRSHAVRLAGEGADIIAIDICQTIPTAPGPGPTPADLAETVKAVESLDRRILAAQIDVRDLGAMTSFVAKSVGELGRLDIVLANAGIAGTELTLEMDEQVWQTMIDINLTGVWKTLKASVPHIIAGGRGGSVVITSSLAALTANEHTAHYSAAKSGLISLMRVLAKELAPHRIRVNTVHPTTVGTEMILNESTYRHFRPDLDHPTRADFEETARTLNRMPVPYIEVEDVTNAILYLVSDEGRYVTGSQQLLDAGGSL